MKIIVLAGGISSERDVSLISGSGICRALRNRGHKAILVDVFLGMPNLQIPLEEVFDLPDGNLSIANGITTSEPDIAAVKASREDQSDCYFGPNVIELCRLADISFLGLHGGFGEDGRLQAAFDVLGIKYTGPDSIGATLSMDKGLTKHLFLEYGVPTPPGKALHRHVPVPPFDELGISLPAVVKPASSGSSIGVFICQTEEEFQDAIKKSFELYDKIVVESFIKGRELACSIIDGKPLPLVEIVPKKGWYDYSNKYQADCTEEICPAPIPDEIRDKIQRATARGYHALSMNVYARGDFILSEDGLIYCLEFNSLPGMTPTSLLPLAAKTDGLSYEDLCELIIEKSMEARYR